MRYVLVLLTLIVTTAAWSQSSLERQMFGRIEKGKWKSAEDLLRKALHKDTLNPEVRYLISEFYFIPQNPGFQIDSAYQYALMAIRDFRAVTIKEKERLRRISLDSAAIVGQREKIDSAAFERAKQVNTERAYQDFLVKFPYAREQSSATELRNEVAYVDAMKLNTWKSFQDYLSKYPSSSRAGEASQRYERLLFEEKTRDGKLKSFESFNQSNPASPYRREVERNIFDITTASGRPATFVSFASAPGPLRSRAEAILYHLQREEDASPIAFTFSDSIRKVQKVEQGFWVPVLRGGKFGFIDHAGNETITPQFDSLAAEYLCGNVRDDVLRVGDGVMGRSGQWIARGTGMNVRDVGSGFLKVVTTGCTRMIHKSGFSVTACVQDVKLIAHNFIAVRQQSKWGLMTFTGRVLLDPVYDDITALDEFVVLVRNGKKTMVTIDEVAGLADKNQLPASKVFDDIQRLATGNYLVKNGSLEGVLNAALEFIVPLNRQIIFKAQEGFLLKRDERLLLAGVSEKLQNREFKSIQFYGNWLKLQEEKNLTLFSLHKKKVYVDLLDSLWFENKLAFAWKHDSVKVYLKSGASLNFASGTKVNFIKSPDSTDYFYTPDKTKKAVFETEKGERLFSYDFDAIEYVGHGLFLVSDGKKKGLLNRAGKVVLPIEYAAIVPGENDVVSLLKDKKFGLYQLVTHKLMKPVYDRNVLLITGNWLVGFKEGGYGFMGWDSKLVGKFEFDEVKPWNDTSALVKKNSQWMIYGIRSQKILKGKIKDFRFISDTPSEKVITVLQDVQYGIMSNKRGEIIPANFTDIVNVGSEDEPFYFAEKNVEEAKIFVVIYYDMNGKLIRKQVYEDEEYEKIYCPDK